MMLAHKVLWGQGISYTKCPQVFVFDLNYTYCLYWKFLPPCSRWQNSGFRHCSSSTATICTSTLKFCFSIVPMSPSTKFVEEVMLGSFYNNNSKQTKHKQTKHQAKESSKARSCQRNQSSWNFKEHDRIFLVSLSSQFTKKVAFQWDKLV